AILLHIPCTGGVAGTGGTGQGFEAELGDPAQVGSPGIPPAPCRGRRRCSRYVPGWILHQWATGVGGPFHTDLVLDRRVADLPYRFLRAEGPAGRLEQAAVRALAQ